MFVYGFMLFAFPSMMAIHHASSKGGSAKVTVDSGSSDSEEQHHGAFVTGYAKFVTTGKGKTVLSCILLVTLAVAAVGMTNFEANLSAKDIFNVDTAEYSFFDLIQNGPAFQQTAPNSWVFQNSPSVKEHGIVPFDFTEMQLFSIHMTNEFNADLAKRTFFTPSSGENFIEVILRWMEDTPNCKVSPAFCAKTWVEGLKSEDISPVDSRWSGYGKGFSCVSLPR